MPNQQCQWRLLVLKGVCEAGDKFYVLESEKQAKEYALKRQSDFRKQELMKQQAEKQDLFFEENAIRCSNKNS